jgi:glutamate-1-semialdehyde aminotransferase
MSLGGMYKEYGVIPDIIVYGKAMSNGYPMGAIVGKDEIMDVAQESFISSTYWTEGIGPTAALATINKLEKNNVKEHIKKTGNYMLDIWEKTGKENNLELHVDKGFPAIGHFDFEYENKQAIATLFTQEMLKRGYLASRGFYTSYSHNKENIDLYSEKLNEVFNLIKLKIDKKEVEKSLEGPIAHSGFQRVT